MHNQMKIQVFQNPTPETLQKRRELKEITRALKEADILHRS